MRRKLTITIAFLILLPMLIGIGCGGSERSHDELIRGPMSAAGFYVLKAAGDQAVSWGTSRAFDYFRGDGEADDAEAIQNSLTQIHADTTAIRNSLDELKGQVAMIDWRLSVGSIADYTTSIRTQWDHYQNYLGINPIDGAPRPDGPEDQPDEAYWTEIVKPAGVREDLRELHYFMTDKPIEAAHRGLLESCAAYLIDKNRRDDREPATLDAMIAYLEQTFLELVDYQARGFILYREAYHVLEQTNEGAVEGKQPPESYLEQDLRPAIRLQALEFLRCAELMLVDNINLAADAGPDGTGVMDMPDHWLYSGSVPEKHLRVFPEGGKEMLERATLTAVKVLSYVDEHFISMRETGEDIFIVHVIGDPIHVAQAPAQYLREYLTIPSGATFDGTLLPRHSFTSLPAEFDGDHNDGLRIGTDDYIQFYRRNMKRLPLEYTTEDGTRVNRKLYVGFREADSIDAAAYRVTGSRPGGWEVHPEEILPPANSELGGDSIRFGHALYSARPIGSYLGFARSVQDLHLIDSNPYRDFTQMVARTLDKFSPPVASRSMSGWSSREDCVQDRWGIYQCRARWLYKYGLKCHLAYSGTGSFTMNLRPAVLVDPLSPGQGLDYDRVMVDAVRLDNKRQVGGGYLFTASESRSLDFSTSAKFKSTTVQVISESSSGKACHMEFATDQQMSLQSLSIVR